MNNIIFILGCGRSGSTLVLKMLTNKQENLGGSSYESQLYSGFLKKEYSLDTYLESKYYNEILTPEEIKKIFNMSNGHISFFKNSANFFIKKKKCKYFVEKSPSNTMYVDRLIDDFEDPHIILLKRDPSAVIHSQAKTKFIALTIDRIPLIPSDIMFFRYISSLLTYYVYYKYMLLVEQYDNTMVFKYEDIVKNLPLFKSEIEKKYNVNLSDLYISRPFSQESEVNEYRLDTSRIYSYKKEMPGWMQFLVHLIFNPTSFFQKTIGFALVNFMLDPIFFLHKKVKR